MSKVVKAIFQPPKIKEPKKPPPPPPPPPPPKEEARLSEKEILMREKQRKGRKSTILTSTRGVEGTAPGRKKTLLGQ